MVAGHKVDNVMTRQPKEAGQAEARHRHFLATCFSLRDNKNERKHKIRGFISSHSMINELQKGKSLLRGIS